MLRDGAVGRSRDALLGKILSLAAVKLAKSSAPDDAGMLGAAEW